MSVVSPLSSQSQAPVVNSAKTQDLSFYYLLFFLSGFPALLYQIVWQRALFTLYGVNIESITMIVTVFMLGLGLGSLAGGRLSTYPKIKPLLAFGLIEASIGAFGLASLHIFHRVGSVTAGHSTFVTGIIAFALLLVPTMLMGSTLPLLVEHVVRRTGNVGESVGSLYCVNTFGSGVACLAAAVVLMRVLGESGSVNLACSFNLIVEPSRALRQLGTQHRRSKERLPDSPQKIPQTGSSHSHNSAPHQDSSLRCHRLHGTGIRNHLVSPLLLYNGRQGPCFALLLAFYSAESPAAQL